MRHLLIVSLAGGVIVLSGAGAVAGEQVCVEPLPGIVAWWPFDETDGTTAADLIRGHAGIHVNSPQPVAGMVAGSLQFDGVDDYVAVPDNDLWAFGTSDFSVEFWANFSSPTDGFYGHPGDVFIGNDQGPFDIPKWFFAARAGGLDFITGPEAYFPFAPFSPVVGQWYHLAVTRTGTNLSFFVDGVPAGSGTVPAVFANPTALLTIGYVFDYLALAPLGYMNGRLDEMTIYHRALSEAELRAIFEAGSAGKCKGVTITTRALSAVQLGVASSQQLEASGGLPPYSWSIFEGRLPNGITLNADGEFSGTPTELGETTFTLQVQDSSIDVARNTYSMAVLLVLPRPELSVSLVSTPPVPGRQLSYFAVVENLSKATARDITVFGFLEPWHTLLGVTPAPATVIQVDDTFPENGGASYEAAIEWGPMAFAAGEAKIFSYAALLDATYRLGETTTQFLCVNAPEGDGGHAQCLDDCTLHNFQGLPSDYRSGFCTIVMKHVCDCLCNGGTESQCNSANYFCPTIRLGPQQRSAAFLSSGSADKALVGAVECAMQQTPATGPVDPNEKLVVGGAYIQPDKRLVYPIHFENIGEVEAIDVFVTDVLDPNLDDSTLQLLTPAGSYDPTTRTVRWELLGRYLQPRETGNVLLSVKPVAGQPSGTSIRNSATIQFEVFEPLVTAAVENVIDTTPPSCLMDPLPFETDSSTFRISWSGSDAIGEVEAYTIFVSTDANVFTPYLGRTLDTNATFAGALGKTYEFFCVAADTAGNVEDQNLAAETTTKIVPRSPFAKLLPDDGAEQDRFGRSVAMTETVAMIGAHGDDDNGDFSGSVYLFNAATGGEIGKLLSSDGAEGDAFGTSVAISGSTALVGAWLDQDNGVESGSAYLFDVLDPANPMQITKVRPDDGAALDWFGISVAISGTVAIVGAPQDQDNGEDSGSAYLFDAHTGEQIAKLLPDDGAERDGFGYSVAISDCTAVVGAYGDDDSGGTSGSAYLFDAVTGQQIAKLLPNDGATQDQFGLSVGISGTTAIVGSNFDDDNGIGSGSAYLFDVRTGQQLAKLLPADGAEGGNFGNSVAISGFTAIVGANRSAYVFDIFDPANPAQIAKLVAADGGFSFGTRVATSGNAAIVGAPFNSDNGEYSGSAYLFSARTKNERDCLDSFENFFLLADCMSGPGQPLAPCCERVDRDVDGDGDLADFAILQAAFGCP